VTEKILFLSCKAHKPKNCERIFPVLNDNWPKKFFSTIPPGSIAHHDFSREDGFEIMGDVLLVWSSGKTGEGVKARGCVVWGRSKRSLAF
jgi:hypothetical protein